MVSHLVTNEVLTVPSRVFLYYAVCESLHGQSLDALERIQVLTVPFAEI